MRGVDVSSYQGDIDWSILSKQNISFAYIKATEGSSLVDDKFQFNWDEANKTDLKVGAYHYFSYDSDGMSQAENFIKTVPIISDSLPPVIDVELYGDKVKNVPDKAKTQEQLSILLDELQNYYGKNPIIYATDKTYNLYIKGSFDDYNIWIRNVFCKPNLSDYKSWTLWQYTDKAKLNGYDGKEKFIDMNVFNGTLEEFDKFVQGDMNQPESETQYDKVVPDFNNAESMQDSLSSTSLKITREKILQTYPKLELFVQYPQISGLSNKNTQDSINKEIKNNCEGSYNEIIELYNEFINKWPWINFLWDHCDYNAYLNGDILSIVLFNDTYSGGVHGVYGETGINVNVKTGKILKLSDLFSQKNWKQSILKEINNQVKKRQILVDDKVTILEDFYIRDNKLVIFYNPYHIASFAEGLITFEMPYKFQNNKFIY
ncbi:MAG: DUF4163 domain-containing protein [Oscillospiraceae bacterium]|nr:DUF4163 domain-containing protein [Oscillospiraceae bacterium]